MMLSYAKHPELRLLDEDECQRVLNTDYRRKLFGMFYHCSEAEGTIFRNRGVVRDGNIPELGGREKMMRGIVGIEKNLISGCLYAHNIKNVYYVPKSFTHAHATVAPKLDNLFTPQVMMDIHEDCCFVLHNGITLLSVWCEQMKAYHFLMFNQGFLMCWHLYNLEQKDGLKDDNSVCCWPGSKEKDWASAWVYQFYGILLFKKYGQMELETVSAHKYLPKSSIIGEKINNFTGMDVTVLDSRWFTTICRDEGFLVSGHFRLQPCKDERGEWTRKLIYINPYAKHGYHRLAPIVNINNEEQQ